MKKLNLFLSGIVLLCSFSTYGGEASGNMDSAQVVVTKSDDLFEKFSATVYDENTGKSFPYRITVKMELGGCIAADYKHVRLEKSAPATATYLFRLMAFNLLTECHKPNRIFSKSYDFPKGDGFIDVIVPKNALVVVERLKE